MTTASKSEFARRLGVSPSYVTKLLSLGRLAMTADGRVDVEKSEQMIDKTKDPNRDDVRRRHRQERKAKAGGVAAPPEAVPAEGDGDGDPDDDLPPSGTDAISYASSKAKKEHFAALTAQLEYERAIGRLVDIESVQQAGTEVGATLRTALENMTDKLAPLLAPVSDEAQVHAMLVEYVEEVLTEIGRKVAEFGRQMKDNKS